MEGNREERRGSKGQGMEEWREKLIKGGGTERVMWEGRHNKEVICRVHVLPLRMLLLGEGV